LDRVRRLLEHPKLPLLLGIVIAIVLVIAFGGVIYLGAYKPISERVEKVETRVNTIETRVVLTPCLQTNDRVCRMFLNRLLAAATPLQLQRLRGVRRLTPQEVRREIKRFERDRRQAAARRRARRDRERRRQQGVTPGKPGGHQRAAPLTGAWGRPLQPPRLLRP